MFLFFLQKEHIALSAYPGILFQKVPHFILPVSKHLIWSLRLGGALGVLAPLTRFSFVGRRPVASSILVFASSRVSWCRIGAIPLMCQRSRALYVCFVLRAWSLAPSWRAGWLSIHSFSSGLAVESLSLPASARASAMLLPMSMSCPLTHLKVVVAGRVRSLMRMPFRISRFSLLPSTGVQIYLGAYILLSAGQRD